MSLKETIKDFLEENVLEAFKMIVNVPGIFAELKNQKASDPSWYFSSEGIAAYEKLSSLGQKTGFFNDYLTLISRYPENRDVLCSIALVMANSMVDSDLEFGGYPNVLDEEKNPLVNYVKNSYYSNELEYNCRDICRALHKGEDISQNPYTTFNYCKENEPLSDIYKIERDIITIFSLKKDELTFFPYLHDILYDSSKKE